jgi:hypothetical protein
MKNFNNEHKLKEIIYDLLWMAARYANGRHTYAPRIIRDVVDDMKYMYPEWKLVKKDDTIKPPEDTHFTGLNRKEDYLYDIFNSNNE